MADIYISTYMQFLKSMFYLMVNGIPLWLQRKSFKFEYF